MRFFDFVILVFLFVLLFTGLYFLWLNLPAETTDFETFYGNISSLSENSSQFYSNMRYVEKNISYAISQKCSDKKQQDFKEAVSILEEKTILKFYESQSPEIIVTCSNIAPEPEEEGHFVAGEGGTTTIINASRYAVITLGKIALYRPETCETPQIAIHEILHALGFDHNNNTKSIMYPFTKCDQEIDKSIIEEIKKIYAQPPAADLVIEKLQANKSGRYVNFETTVANNGLKLVEESSLILFVDGELIKSFNLEELDIGSKRNLRVENLRVPRNTKQIKFRVQTQTPEISKANNEAELKIAETTNKI